MAKRIRTAPFLRECGKKKQHSQGRINNLPIEILLYILSFLSFKEAAVTALVSSQWVHLWKYFPRLDFDANETLHRVAPNGKLVQSSRVKFTKWVNQVLAVHKCYALNHFKIFFDLNKLNKHDIDKWLEFAFDKGVQMLELNLLQRGNDIYIRPLKGSYSFPAKLFSQCRSGRVRHLLCGGLHSSTEFRFNLLKAMCLKCVNITDEVLKSILCYCSLLERLEVYGSRDLVNVEVSGPSLKLKYLEICFCEDLKYIKVCNNNLVSFKFVGNVKCVVPLDRVPFLVEVSIGWAEYLADVFASISSCLANLEVLNLYYAEAQYDYHHRKYMERCELPELPRLKQLSFMVRMTFDSDILRFPSWMEAYPCLEKFKIHSEWVMPFRRGREIKEPPYRPHYHLKVVEMRGYFGRDDDIEFVNYVLKNAVALEELVIDHRNQNFLETPISRRSHDPEEASAKKVCKELERIVPSHVKLVIL